MGSKNRVPRVSIFYTLIFKDLVKLPSEKIMSCAFYWEVLLNCFLLKKKFVYTQKKKKKNPVPFLPLNESTGVQGKFVLFLNLIAQPIK